MLHPSYTDLMKVVNQDVEEGEIKGCKQPVFHRYLQRPKRARQLIDGELPTCTCKGRREAAVNCNRRNECRRKLKILGRKCRRGIR